MRTSSLSPLGLGCLAAALLLVDGTRAQGGPSTPRRPNIIILLADDLGYADVGFHGCRDIPTPHIDSLARNGVRCTNGYVSGPYCSPTRAGLLTGRYQERFGHEFNPAGGVRAETIGLPLTEITIADRLKPAGYATGLVGKWHLGGAPKFHPRRRGFDEFFGFLDGSHSYFPGKDEPILRGSEVVHEPEYLTDALAREAVAFIDRHKREPFFLELAFNAVHTPMHAPEERTAKFASIADKARRTYAAMLTALDEAVGRVLDKLSAESLEENSLIIFLSDNGGPTMPGTSVNGARNDPLRGSKRTTLEGGIRVPFVVQWKGTLAAAVYDRPVIQLDLLPTALAAARVEAKPEWKLDGVNLLPFFQGPGTARPHETLYWRFGDQMAIRRGDWKLVRYDANADAAGAKSNRESRAGVTPLRLYNLAQDLGESQDLSEHFPETVSALNRAWQEWDAQLAKPLWGPSGQ
jgi:arylsulfatase A-like enzyme